MDQQTIWSIIVGVMCGISAVIGYGVGYIQAGQAWYIIGFNRGLKATENKDG